ncbi:MAG: DUF1844 domain-containing protein [Phycisphaerae bacterium]|nr:DUF1844 domain-containing protein [Phycisphaerae bacterium]
MADQSGETPKIQVDSDWKEEAKREKERLAKEAEAAGENEPLPAAEFVEVIRMIYMQAMVGLGGMQTPDGQSIPPNLEAAKYHVDLLGVLEEKTKGNLSNDEKQLMDAALYELRMRFVQAMSAPAAETEPPA